MLNRASIADVYRTVTEQITKQILQTSDDQIINLDTEYLVDKFYQGNHFDPVAVDASRAETMMHKKELRKVPAHRREDFYRSMGDTDFEYESLVITIPLIPNDQISQIVKFRPSTFSMSWSPEDVAWSQNSAQLSIDIKGYGFKYEDQQIKSNVDFQKSRVYEFINWIGADIRKENETLQNVIRRLVGDRRQKIEGDKGRVSSLSALLGIAEENSKPEIEAVISEIPKTNLQSKKQNTLNENEYDAFISYASEDKKFATELVEALKKEGVKTWFDGFEVKWGDDLRSTIDKGLVACKYGVVVFSRSYLSKKRWTEYELNGLFAKEKNKKVVLPVWHEITREEVLAYSPQLADRVAKKSDQIKEIVSELKDLLAGS